MMVSPQTEHSTSTIRPLILSVTIGFGSGPDTSPHPLAEQRAGKIVRDDVTAITWAKITEECSGSSQADTIAPHCPEIFTKEPDGLAPNFRNPTQCLT
jgi:hypothetical protein